MIILLHSSKTMRRGAGAPAPLRQPVLLEKALRLGGYLKTLSAPQLAKIMSISPALAEKTHALAAEWTADPAEQSLALDSFVGDIYSGLHANDLSPQERDSADRSLRILSGLYGILRPYDGIYPYRLEMGYRLPDQAFASLYTYWGEDIANLLQKEGLIVNLAAAEYSQVVTRYVDTQRVVTPKFLTVHPKTGEPSFVVVHAKIARGAFARWLISAGVKDAGALPEFTDLGYRWVESLSAPGSPTFVCEEFGGKGLSIRLQGVE